MAGTNGQGRSCKGTNTAGEPCASPIVNDAGWCPAHEPGGYEALLERAHRGGQVTKRMLEAGLQDLPPLDSPKAAQEWLERIARAVAFGRLNASAGQAAIRAVSEWRSAYEATEQADPIARLEAKVEELRAAGVL